MSPTPNPVPQHTNTQHATRSRASRNPSLLPPSQGPKLRPEPVTAINTPSNRIRPPSFP
ncbi:hypothetical protein AOQ84DRAFT_353623 [Glonium stellatum]|uniref:Uncharacterized protein n=1 Tax=Glonium stellatum TaxID=574774 RepID=A0A8E2F469_9PEZI|nr:hypothetical protein AOQ84DRAFT_353623 [Glonium stellatum]